MIARPDRLAYNTCLATWMLTFSEGDRVEWEAPNPQRELRQGTIVKMFTTGGGTPCMRVATDTTGIHYELMFFHHHVTKLWRPTP